MQPIRLERKLQSQPRVDLGISEGRSVSPDETAPRGSPVEIDEEAIMTLMLMLMVRREDAVNALTHSRGHLSEAAGFLAAELPVAEVDGSAQLEGSQSSGLTSLGLLSSSQDSGPSSIGPGSFPNPGPSLSGGSRSSQESGPSPSGQLRSSQTPGPSPSGKPGNSQNPGALNSRHNSHWKCSLLNRFPHTIKQRCQDSIFCLSGRSMDLEEGPAHSRSRL